MKTKLIDAKIFTCNNNFDIIENGMIIINNDKIEYVGDIKEYDTDKTIHCKGAVILPGLINGCAIFGEYVVPSSSNALEDLELCFDQQRQNYNEEKFQNSINQFSQNMVSEGVTTVFDYSGYGKICASIFQSCGMRHFVGVGLFDKGQIVSEKELKEQIDFINKTKSSVFLYSNETYTLSDERLLPIVKMLNDYEVHFPIHRSLVDVGACVKASGLSPVAFLNELGILDYPTKLLYGTSMDKEDMSMLKDKDTIVTLCPIEDMYLGYGLAPIVSYLRQGIKVGIGTGKENVAHTTMRELIRSVFMLGNSQFHNPTTLSGKDVLKMCTSVYQKYGIGVLQKDYFADILIIDNKDFLTKKEDLFTIKDHLQMTMIGGQIVFGKE